MKLQKFSPYSTVNNNNSVPRRILFVCLGNICRSPLAEAIFNECVKKHGTTNVYIADSAGIDSYHIGEPPDPRTIQIAQRHGITINHRARVITPEDIDSFDYFLAMDRSNYRTLQKLFQKYRAEKSAGLYLMREFDPLANPSDIDVPDPYYGTLEDFEEVYQILARTIANFYLFLEKDHGNVRSISHTTT